MSKEEQGWTTVVKPRSNWFRLNLREIWKYRDLILLFVRRDVVTIYKQTILGPLWIIVQPLLTTLIFTVVFGNIANISTEEIPPLLFYFSGIILWNYFADCLKTTSDTFRKNANLFGKVYFPRAISPLSVTVSNLIKLGIQFLLFLAIYTYYIWAGFPSAFNIYLLAAPALIVITGFLSLGLGMIISSLTTKYRDLSFLIVFGIQLAMYASPVIYPLSEAPEKYHAYILANPMSAIIEAFRYMFLGAGSFNWIHLSYSFSFTIVIVLIGLVIFNKTEKTFMDTV
jgi:lipopolysaccharide transport system permease protein